MTSYACKQSLWVAAAILACLSSLAAGASNTEAKPTCRTLNQTDRARLIDYVEKKYKTPKTMPVALAHEEFVGACFRTVEFKSGDPKRSFQLRLFLSPDLRFLSPELMDSTVDPVLEERRKQQALFAGLTNGDFPSRGPKNAKVTLTIFSDFQCPYCAQLARTLSEVWPSEAKTTRMVFRYFPLPMHDWARPAAEAAACVQEQGDDYFWQLHDFMFEHQGEFTPGNVMARITAKVDQDIAFGTRSDVNATPTVFINGERVGPVTAPEQLRTLIREAGSKPTPIASLR